MRVLHVNKFYAPHVGGVERVVQDLAEGMRGEIETAVLACGPGPSEVRGIPVVRASSIGTFLSMPISFSFAGSLGRLSADFDLLHFHLPFPLAVWAQRWARPEKPYVVTWHSDVVRQRRIAQLWSGSTRAFLDEAAFVVPTSARLVEFTETLRSLKTPCEPIPLGIDPAPYEPTPERVASAKRWREKYGAGPLALFVGRLAAYKGVDVLLRAMARVDASVRLVIVGDGPERGKLQSIASDRVTFAGSLSDAEVIEHYHASDFLVLPSIHPSEAFGLVQLEAMAAGLPVVNTSLPTGVPWVSLDGVSGLTVAPGDVDALAGAINRLARDAPLRRTLGRGALERVRSEFTRDLMCRRYLDLYRRACGSPSGGVVSSRDSAP